MTTIDDAPKDGSQPRQSTRGQVALLFAVSVVGMSGFGMIVPILPYFALEFGANGTETTWAIAAYAVGQLFASPVWGRISDRFGRKPVLALGALGAALSYLWLSQAQTVFYIAASRLFGGVMAGTVGAAFAYAADISDERSRTGMLGLIGASVGLGFILGPAFGAILAGEQADLAAFERVCFASAAVALLACALTVFFLRESLTPEARAGLAKAKATQPMSVLKRPLIAALLFAGLLAITARALMETIFGLWSEAILNWGPMHLGLSLAFFGLIGAGLQGGAAGRIASRIGDRALLQIGLAIFALGFIALIFTAERWLAYTGLCLLAVGAGLWTPALQGMVSKSASASDQGEVMGLYQSAGALARVIGPLAAGPIFDAFGPASPYWLAVLLCLAAMVAIPKISPRPAPAS